MQWFYANESDQQVAFEEENFKTLVEGGNIKKDTLIWNEALPDWKPCLDIRPELFEVPPSVSISDQPNATVPDLAPPLPPQTGESSSSDTLAVTSLVLGILSVFGVPLTGFAAVILGHISRKKLVERTGSTEGGGISLAGLILGYIGILLGFALVMVVVMLAIIGSNSPT